MFIQPDTRRAALSSLLSLRMFYLRVPLLGSRKDAAITNHLAACFLEVCTPVSTVTSHQQQQRLVQVHLFQRTLCIPEEPYLSRQVMGNAAKPRHMLRAGQPGSQQLIESLRGWQEGVTGGCSTTCPAVVCWRLEQRRGAALYIG